MAALSETPATRSARRPIQALISSGSLVRLARLPRIGPPRARPGLPRPNGRHRPESTVDGWARRLNSCASLDSPSPGSPETTWTRERPRRPAVRSSASRWAISAWRSTNAPAACLRREDLWPTARTVNALTWLGLLQPFRTHAPTRSVGDRVRREIHGARATRHDQRSRGRPGGTRHSPCPPRPGPSLFVGRGHDDLTRFTPAWTSGRHGGRRAFIRRQYREARSLRVRLAPHRLRA